MRGHPTIYVLAVALAAVSVSASAAPTTPANSPPSAETNAVRKVVAWALTLNTFKGAAVTNKDSSSGKWRTAETQIKSTDDSLVLSILDDGNLYADLRARPPWSDKDTILLRAIAKHLTGDPGEPITPSMAISSIKDDLPTRYLTNGKLEFGYYKARMNLCPWKGDCYAAGIWVTPP